MGSYPDTVNLLEHLRSKSQIDCDSLDIQLATELGPFVGCTTNQADSYLELLVPQRKAILEKSAALGQQLQSKYPGVKYEQLAVEIAMVSLSLTIAPLITGAIYVMSNPTLTSTSEIVENAQRIVSLCGRLEPNFNMSRLCIKVKATWEGLQACKKLTALGISTLATTLFTMEQVILAGEVGCAYISPFVHELKAFFDETYDDGGPNLKLCLEAQKFYEERKCSTRVKAAGLLNAGEAKQLAGVDSMTIAPELLRILSKTEEPEVDITKSSIFARETNISDHQTTEKHSFVNDEKKYREAFARSYGGKGAWKTQEAIDIFCGYQIKAESLLQDTKLMSTNLDTDSRPPTVPLPASVWSK